MAAEMAGDASVGDESQAAVRLPSRSTRGKRMSELVGEELEADEEFWGQTAWQDHSDDESIRSNEWSSDDLEDKEDSDFDAVDEAAEESDRQQQAADAELQEVKRARSERQKRRRGVYVDPALRTGSSATAKRPRAGAPRADKTIVMPSTRELRRSTQASTISTKSALRELKRSRAKNATARPAKAPLVSMTQRQLLEEAARTEIENKRSLELMLMLQEEKKRERSKAEVQQVPRIVYYSSSRGVRRDAEGKALDPIKHTITFTRVGRIPSVINAVAPALPERPVCQVTGLPAKYRDPVSGIPFRTTEAFKVLRGSQAVSGAMSGASAPLQKSS
mmetsp:Transcript_10253/g.25998  ORF Transcript_10253/g.25998 Transcript_10253/m.25998 type:complete len:334 (-) Transcript_10253:132-1133(-)